MYIKVHKTEVLTRVMLMTCWGVSAAFVKQETVEGNRQAAACLNMPLGLIDNVGSWVTAVNCAPS